MQAIFRRFLFCLFCFSSLGAQGQSVRNDALCAHGERSVDLTPMLPNYKDQGATSTCTFFGVCVLGELERDLPSGIKPKPLSELYMVLQTFNSRPDLLQQSANEVWKGIDSSLISNNFLDKVSSGLQSIGQVPVSKDPEKDRVALERITRELSGSMSLESYRNKIRAFLQEYQSSWEWDTDQILDSHDLNPRVLSGLPALSAKADHLAFKTMELRRAQSNARELMTAVKNEVLKGEAALSAKDPSAQSGMDMAAYKNLINAHFKESALENTARLSIKDFKAFAQKAAKLRCAPPYSLVGSRSDCESDTFEKLSNIRNALRHFQALDLAGKRDDFRTPAVISGAKGIDQPLYDFPKNRSISTALAEQKCDPEDWKAARDVLLQELCRKNGIAMTTKAVSGLEASELDARNHATGKWAPAPELSLNDKSTLEIHAMAIVGYDPSDGGYFLIRNSYGPRAGLLRLPASQSCQVRAGLVLDRSRPPLRQKAFQFVRKH